MKRFNITVVFDAILRPDTTSVYVVRALRELGHNVSHYMPCLSQEGRLIFEEHRQAPRLLAQAAAIRPAPPPRDDNLRRARAVACLRGLLE